MDAIKDDTTASLDELTSLGDETIAFYRDLVDRIDHDAIRQRLVQAVAEQGALIEALTRARQRQGALPQIGDPERGHLLAMLTTIRALAASDDTPVVERLIDANNDLMEAAENAAECDLETDAQRCVERLTASCRSFARSLRR
jgi:hypothetical protein